MWEWLMALRGPEQVIVVVVGFFFAYQCLHTIVGAFRGRRSEGGQARILVELDQRVDGLLQRVADQEEEVQVLKDDRDRREASKVGGPFRASGPDNVRVVVKDKGGEYEIPFSRDAPEGG